SGFDGSREHRGLGIEIGRDLRADHHRPGRVELPLALPLANSLFIDPEVNQVAPAVRNVGPPLLDALRPAVEVEHAVLELDIRATQADTFPIDAREVGLAADPATVSTVERVVPDIQLERGGRVDGGDEVDSVVGHVHDVFVGTDAIVGRDLQVRQLQVPG